MSLRTKISESKLVWILTAGVLVAVFSVIATPLIDFYLSVPYIFILGSEASSIDLQGASTLALTLVTAMMVVAIYQQVLEQEKHLRSFEPTLEFVKSSEEIQSHAANIKILAQNTSQTSTIITEVEASDSEGQLDCSVVDQDRTEKSGNTNVAQYFIHEESGKIPVEANKSTRLVVALRAEREIKGELKITFRYLGPNKEGKEETVIISVDKTPHKEKS